MQWALVSADVPDELIMKPEPGLLPEGWDALPSSPVSQKYGADWVMGGINLAISLPSSVIPEERNLLINVRHPDFVKIQISNPQPFYFDRRLG
jgi:RES domain-containing protein